MTPRERAQVRTALERLRSHLVSTGPARIEPNRQDAATSGVADEDAQALSEMMQVLASKRLALVPYATLCVACQAKRDPKLVTSRKKLT
jgi:DnaK suppressor protein